MLELIPPWLVLVLLGGALVVVVLLLLASGRGRTARDPVARRAAAADAEPGADAPNALAVAETPEPGDHVPWIALVGAPGAPTAAIAASLPEVRHRPAGGAVPRLRDAAIRLTEGGALIDAGDRLFADDDGPERWRRWLADLARQRPRRPLDAVVAVVPAALLVGAEPERGERLLGLARALRDLLWRAERETGLRLPFTLLIAADDALPGGEDLVDALAHRPDRGFLGWAAPGGGAVVDRDTVESGLDEARERLGRLVTELLACAPDRTDTAAAGRLVVLPARFREVADGVVELADHLLLPIAYREPLLLRGVHPVVPASRPAAGAAGFRFVRELFARRIFPEVRLAVPSRVAASRRHRQVRWAQIALAVGALLAVGGWSWLALDRSDVVSVRTLLSSLASELRAVQSAPNDQKLLEATAISLIGALSNLSAETVESTLAPTSHLTGATDRVVDAIRVGSRFALLRATARQLQEIKVDAALAHLEGAAAPPEGTAQLEAALNALTRLRGEIGAYRELHRAPDAGAVADVVGYAFAEELPANFSRHAQLYVDALRGAPLPTVSTERIAERVTPALEEAIRDLARAQLVERGPVQALARIAPLDTGGAGTLPMASFADAVLALRDLQDELARDPAWLASGSGPLPPELGRLVEGVAALCPRAGDALCLVEPTFPQRLADELGTFVDAQRERILTAALFGVRPAVVEGDEGWRLAPPLARAEAALEDYFRNLDLEPVPPPVRATLPVRPDAPLAWDPAGLDGLLNLSAELLVVDTEAFDRLPASVATTARALAERRLAQLLDAEIRRAAERGRGLGEGRDDAALAGAFRLAEAPLRVLHERFRQLSMPALADRLDRAARPQAQALLERADRLRAREGLYTLFDPTLSAWDGSEPLTFAAFNVYRPGELPGVLGRWRDGLAALSATYAEPSVGYLEAVATDAPPGPLQRRWTSIAQRLATYDRQLPENTLVQFERFVLERTAELTLDSCGELTPPPAGGDYFRDLQRDLATAIRRRCAELEGRELVVGYADLADAFNASLAGRYPFADPDGDPAAMAEPATVRRFFTGPGADLERLRAAVAERAGGARVRRFLDQLIAARAALAPLLEPPADLARLAYEVRADYRPLPQLDRGGEQIIEGWIAAGGERRGSFASGPPPVWEHGETFALGLRWANRAPLRPAPGPGLRVAERSVVVEDRSPWALFRLADRLGGAAPGALPAAPATAGTLRLDVPVEPNPERGEGGRDDFRTATLYVRLDVTALVATADGETRREPVRLGGFPAEAPHLETGGDGGRW